jgi:hypothetical protein
LGVSYNVAHPRGGGIVFAEEVAEMSKNKDWIDKRLSEAKKSQPLVTDGVIERMKSLLKNEIGERPLTPKELADIAKELIADMNAPVPPETEERREN